MAIEDEVILNLEAEDKSVETTTKQVIEAMQELEATIKKITSSFNNFNNESNNVNKSNKKTEDSTKKVISSMNKYRLTGLGVGKMLKDWTLQAAEAYGVQTRFNALFDRTNGELQEAKRWVNEWSDALYLDSIEVENVASKFRLLTQTMGVNNTKSLEMTENMTKLSYDLAAVTGHQEDVSTTMNAINSALAGQTKALTKYGIALNQASLQETLNAAGINRKVASLNSAEKAELIYTQIMKQSAGMQGYYAKTLMSPANAANIVKTQFSMLAREIGNVFIPILMALVPIVIAVTRALRSLAQAIAGFFGISIDFDAYEDGFQGISAGIGGVGEQADEAAGKVKNLIRDFDDLHVINFDTDTGSGSGAGIGGGAGGGSLFDKQEYADWQSVLDKITDKFKILELVLKAVGGAILGFAIGKLIGKFLEFIGVLNKANSMLFLVGTTLAGIGLALWIDANQDIKINGLTKANIVETIMGALVAGTGGALIALAFGASPLLALEIGLGIAIILTGINLVTGIAKGISDKYRDEIDELKAKYGWDEEGTTLQMKIRAAIIIAGTITLNIFDDLKKAIEDKWNNSDIESKMQQIGGLIIAGIGIGIITAVAGIPGLVLGVFTAFVMALVNIFEIHSPSKAMEPYGEYIMLGIFEGLKAMLDKTVEIFVNLKDKAIEKMIELKNKLTDKVTEIKTNITNKFTEIKTNVTNKIDEIKTNVTTKFDNIKKTITDKINGAKDAVKSAIDKIKSFFNFDWKLPDIKIPHFGIDWDASGAVGQAFQKLGMPGLPKLKVDWYATGGFPDKGDLFIANEREPELIGSMGNRSVVANNAQITEGIAQASYNAFRQAFREMGDSFGGDTLVYVGDTQLTDVITKKKSIRDRRFGR